MGAIVTKVATIPLSMKARADRKRADSFSTEGILSISRFT